MVSKKYFSLFLFVLIFNGFLSAQYDKTYELKGGFKRVEKDGKSGFLNAADELVIPLMYDNAGNFNDDQVAAILLNKKIGFIDKNNKMLIEPKYTKYFSLKGFDGYLVAVDDLRGVVSFKGVEVISPIYGMISDFNAEGNAIAELNGKYGLINTQGKEVLAFKFKQIYLYENGMAACEYEDGSYSFISESGEVLKDSYDHVRAFTTEGLTRVKKDGKYGYINTKGKIIAPIDLMEGKDFKDDYAFVVKNNELGRISTKGVYEKYVNGMGNPYDSIYIKNKNEGIVPVQFNNKYGAIGVDGQIIIQPIYDLVDYFNKGMSCVGQNGWYGSINAKNEIVIPFKYKAFKRHGFEEIIIMYLEKGADIYSPSGKLVYSCESISDLGKDKEGKYTVSINGEKKYINLNGEWSRDKTTDELATEQNKSNELVNWEAEEKKKNIQKISTSLSTGEKGTLKGLSLKYSSTKKSMKDYTNDFLISNGKIISFGAKDIEKYKTKWMKSIALTNTNASNEEFASSNTASKTKGKFITGAIINQNELVAINGYSLVKHQLNQEGKYDSICSMTSKMEMFKVLKVNESTVVALAAEKSTRKEVENIYLVLWDHVSNKTTSLLLAKGEYLNPIQFISLSNGEIMFAFNQFGFNQEYEEEYYYTYLERINILETNKTGKIKSIWKNHYSAADKYLLTDLIEDKNGNFLGVFQSEPYSIEFKNGESMNKAIDIGIAKISKDGKTFQSKVIKTLTTEQWGRSSSNCKLNMYEQDVINFSSHQKPRIIQSPYDNGYLVLCRFAYGVWKYECDGNSFYKGVTALYSGHTAMLADQPAILYIDGNSLDVHSADFIESTGEDMAHDTKKFSRTNTLGENYNLAHFAYVKENDKFLVLEKNATSSYLFSFSIYLDNNWKGGVAENGLSSVTASNSTSTNNNKTGNSSSTTSSTSSSSTSDKTEEYSGQVHFHFDHANKTKGERLYIHYGSNGSSKTSTGVGSDASIKCEAGKVYYSFTGEKKDMILITELKPSDCNKKFYSKDFVK